MRIPRKTKKMVKKRWLKREPFYMDLKIIKSSINKEFEFEGRKVWGCKVEWLKPV